MLTRLRKPIALLASIAFLLVFAPIALADGGTSSSGAVPSASASVVTR